MRRLLVTTSISVTLWFCLGGVAVWAQLLVRPAPSLAVNLEVGERSALSQADELLADGQFDEAVDKLQELIGDQGDKLLPHASDAEEGGFARYLPLSRWAFIRLSATRFTHPEVLEIYRRRVDPLARRWFEEGVDRRDHSALKRVAEQLFASSYGDDALMRLGEIALERAEFATARDFWQRISPLLRSPSVPERDEGGLAWWDVLRGVDLESQWATLEPLLTQPRPAQRWLAYPDTDLPMGDVRARLVLVSILEGSPARARLELELLKRLHPDAEGTIAGRQGKYTELLGTLLEESQEWPRLAPPANGMTFAGSPDRRGLDSHAVDVRPQPSWRLDLPRIWLDDEMVGADRPRVGEGSRLALGYHPLVWQGLVLWNSARGIFAHRVHGREKVWGLIGEDKSDGAGQGSAAWKIYPRNLPAPPEETTDEFTPRREHVGAPRFTMTTVGDKLFARLGDPVTSSRDDDRDRAKIQRSFIVGLDLAKQASMLPGFPLHPGNDVRWEFEGSPISDGSRLYVAMRYASRESAAPDLYVACYSLPTVPEANDQLRRPVWRVKICNAQTPAGAEYDEVTHNLLSLHEGVLYCNSNMGVVTALSADDGEVQWAVRYPRSPLLTSESRSALRSRDPNASDLHYFRDLNPCLCYHDLVIVAPSDCNQIFALDGKTGQVVWSSRNVDVTHLLGVANGHLIASGMGLYWIDIGSGRLSAQFPPPGSGPARGFGRSRPNSYGRGVLAGNLIYWPTRDRIFMLDQRPLKSPLSDEPSLLQPVMRRQPMRLGPFGGSGGNLVVADGALVVAGDQRLAVYEE